ncbi:MAG: hypothetical protein AAFP80_00760 [Pseudomonadota bacterium]
MFAGSRYICVVLGGLAVAVGSSHAQSSFLGMTCEMTKMCDGQTENCMNADWRFDVNAGASGFPETISWGDGYLLPDVVEPDINAIMFGSTDAGTRTSYMFVLERSGKTSGVYVSKDPRDEGMFKLSNIYFGKCEELR